jgi:RAB protein geranylgeranyltransferase component A
VAVQLSPFMDNQFDVAVLGTGLTESIVAAYVLLSLSAKPEVSSLVVFFSALSKAGFKVVHIDENPYYGADEASLSLDELLKWVNDRTSSSSGNQSSSSAYLASQKLKFTSISVGQHNLSDARAYSISLSPSIIPAIGPLTESLTASGVSRYGGFRLLAHVGIYDQSGRVKGVPESKEHIFKSKAISLLEKRRLMRFLAFAAGDLDGRDEIHGKENVPLHEFLQNEFSLNNEAATAITFALAYCTSVSGACVSRFRSTRWLPSDIRATDPTLPALKRLHRYLHSAGRYGPSPFLVGYYGGAGEIAQGFCRTSAVHGGVYILGKRICSITEDSHASPPVTGSGPTYTLTLDDFPYPVTCTSIVSCRDYLPPSILHTARAVPPPHHETIEDGSIARCIAIIDRPIQFVQLAGASFSESDVHSPEDRPVPGTSLLVFPPSSLKQGSSTVSAIVLITGDDSMSSPKGRCACNHSYIICSMVLSLNGLSGIVYISMPVHDSTRCPESLLKPYLDATLSLTGDTTVTSPIQSLFTAFYVQHTLSPDMHSAMNTSSNIFVTPSPSPLLVESLDAAATNAEAVFWEVLDMAKLRQEPADSQTGRSGEMHIGEIGRFWPSLRTDVEDAEEW